MAYRKNTKRVANKLKALIKARIKELGLIDTGLCVIQSLFIKTVTHITIQNNT